MASSDPTELQALFRRNLDRLEDFWSRESSRPRFAREMTLFGRPVKFTSNDEGVLEAADLCRTMYSAAPRAWDAPFTIQLIVHAMPAPPGPPPDAIARHIQYTADGDQMAMQIGPWGHCQIDLAAARALAVLAPELARRPDLVSQWLFNTILTNLFMAHGLSMLHATGLVRGDRALLLMAPHNSGKSTTALRLALAGYRLLSDSQIYFRQGEPGLRLMGFPVGRLKLREDALPEFLGLARLLAAEPVRDETKYIVDLRRLDPALVYETDASPARLDVCLLRRSPDGRTRLAPAGRAEAMEAAVLNSLHAHTEAVWQRNLAALERLLNEARWHHLEIGADSEEIVAVVDRLWLAD